MENLKCYGCKKELEESTKDEDELMIIINDLGYIAFYHQKCFNDCPPDMEVFPEHTPEDQMKEHREIMINQMKHYAQTMPLTKDDRYKLDLMISKLMEVENKVSET